MTTETWFFTTQGQTVVMSSTSLPPGGGIGDARSVIEPGGRVMNLSYVELIAAGSGEVVISNGVARIA